MLSSEDVSQLLANMKRHAGPAAGPGCSFVLLGNSFNSEQKLVGTTFATRRAECIATMLELGGVKRHVNVSDALRHDGFSEILSRSEMDWLTKLPSDTVIGPAYAPTGELIGQSFAVWSNVRVGAPVEKEALAR